MATLSVVKPKTTDLPPSLDSKTTDLPPSLDYSSFLATSTAANLMANLENNPATIRESKEDDSTTSLNYAKESDEAGRKAVSIAELRKKAREYEERLELLKGSTSGALEHLSPKS